MKYVRKLQTGGGLVTYTPAPISAPMTSAAPQGGAATSSSSDEGGGSIKPDKLLNSIINSKGLTNETNQLLSELKNLQMTFSYSDAEGWPYYIEMAAKLNNLRRNEQMWSDAYTSAKSSGGLNEVAVGTQGQLYVKDKKGDIKSVSAQQYKQSANTQLLTVADLLNERDKNPHFINDTSIFSIANTSVGMKTITDKIKSVVDMLGNEKISTEDFVSKEQATREIGKLLGKTPDYATIKGVEILNKGLKVTTETDTQRNHVDKAMRYLYTVVLGSNEQHKIKAQAALNGVTVGEILRDIFTASPDHSEKIQIQHIADPKDSASSGSGSGGVPTGAKPLEPIQTLVRGTYTLDQSRAVFNNPDINSKYDALSFGSMAFTTVKNEPMGATNLFEAMKLGGWEQVGDMNEIYFGNKLVKPTELRQIVTDGTSQIAHVVLPVKADGSPDNEALEEFNQIMTLYRENPEQYNIEDVKELFHNNGFNVNIDNQGNFNVSVQGSGTRTKPFLLTWGYTTGGSRLIDDNNNPEYGGARKLSKEDSSRVYRIVEEAWESKKVINGKVKNESDRPRALWGEGKRLYMAPIVIATQENYVPKADQSVGRGPHEVPYMAERVAARNQNSRIGTSNFKSSTINDAI